MKKHLLTSALVLAATVLGACSHSSKTTEASQVTQYQREQVDAASKNKASFVKTVEFNKGSQMLTSPSAEELRSMVMEAKSAGEIDEIRVAVWADEAYPMASEKKLSSQQRRLADDRGRNIKNYLKSDLKIDDVDVYSMAERPNAVEKFFNTSDAKVKTAMETSGMTTDPAVLSGNVSKATVMIVMKE